MNVVFMILLFIAPGLMHEALKESLRLTGSRAGGTNIYKQLFYVVLKSVVISGVSISMLMCTGMIPMVSSFQELLREMDAIDITVKITAGIIIATVACYNIYNRLIGKAVFRLKKMFFRRAYNVEPNGDENYTVWEEITLSQPKNDRMPLITIHRDDVFITAGLIENFDQGAFSVSQLRLTGELETLDLMEKDKRGEADIFSKLEVTFVDVKTGYIIRFYDSKKLYEHWPECKND